MEKKRLAVFAVAALCSVCSFLCSCDKENSDYLERISDTEVNSLSVRSGCKITLNMSDGDSVASNDVVRYDFSFEGNSFAYDSYKLSVLPMRSTSVPSDREELKDKYPAQTQVYSGNYYFFRNNALYSSDYILLDKLKTDWTGEDRIITASSELEGMEKWYGFSPEDIPSKYSDSTQFVERLLNFTEKCALSASKFGYCSEEESDEGKVLKVDLVSYCENFLSDFSDCIASLSASQSLREGLECEFFKKYMPAILHGVTAGRFIQVMNGGKLYFPLDGIFSLSPFFNIEIDYPSANDGESAYDYFCRVAASEEGDKTLGELFLPQGQSGDENMRKNITAYFFTPIKESINNNLLKFDGVETRLKFDSRNNFTGLSLDKSKKTDTALGVSTLSEYTLSVDFSENILSLADFSACQIFKA